MGFFDWLFGAPPATDDDSALAAAIDQVMAGTDPRLKALGGARERLAPAVAHALDYARCLAREMPAAIPLAPGEWSASPVLRALFAQPAEVARTLGASADLQEYLAGGGNDGGAGIHAILVASPSTHTTFGSVLVGEVLRRDVKQRRISFGDFRLAGFSADAPALAARLEAMTLEALVLEALAQVAAGRRRGRALEAEHGLLQHRLALLRQSRAGLNSLEQAGDHHQDVAALQRQLGENEAALATVRGAGGWLETTLETVAGHLAAAERQLAIRPATLWLDPMNVLCPAGSPAATPVHLTEIARPGHPLGYAVPVLIRPGDVTPPRLDLDAALRLL